MAPLQLHIGKADRIAALYAHGSVGLDGLVLYECMVAAALVLEHHIAIVEQGQLGMDRAHIVAIEHYVAAWVAPYLDNSHLAVVF